MLPVVYEDLIKLVLVNIPDIESSIDKRMSDIWFSLYNQILEMYNE